MHPNTKDLAHPGAFTLAVLRRCSTCRTALHIRLASRGASACHGWYVPFELYFSQDFFLLVPLLFRRIEVQRTHPGSREATPDVDLHGSSFFLLLTTLSSLFWLLLDRSTIPIPSVRVRRNLGCYPQQGCSSRSSRTLQAWSSFYSFFLDLPICMQAWRLNRKLPWTDTVWMAERHKATESIVTTCNTWFDVCFVHKPFLLS